MPQNVERGECRVCGSEVPVDGEQAIERHGDVLCADCTGDEVRFAAECDNQFCDWEYEYEGAEFQRDAVKTRVQQEANHHETTQRLLYDDPMHSIDVWEVAG
jgi:hypothetical protein